MIKKFSLNILLICLFFFLFIPGKSLGLSVLQDNYDENLNVDFSNGVGVVSYPSGYKTDPDKLDPILIVENNPGSDPYYHPDLKNEGNYWVYYGSVYVSPEEKEDDSSYTSHRKDRDKWTCLTSTYNCVKSRSGYNTKAECQAYCKPSPPPVAVDPNPDSDSSSSDSTRIYRCYKCEGSVCKLKSFRTPCSNYCRSNSQCATGSITTSTPPTDIPDSITPPVSPPPVSPPPPKCEIFEFSINDKTNNDEGDNPLFVWVNAVLKGHISVNDSCTQCTVTSDDTWGNPSKNYTITSSGTYINETFKIPEPGTYFFTLKCIGNPADPYDFDEDTTSLKAVEALHLPWWQEIIPSNLQGFLKGLIN